MKRTLVLDPDADSCIVDDKYILNLTTLLSKIDTLSPSLGQLPPVVRYISPWNKRGNAFVLIEGKPHIRTVVFLDQVYSIPVPWFHIGIVLTLSGNEITTDLAYETFVSFSKTKLESNDHIFYPPYFYNISKSTPHHIYQKHFGGRTCNEIHTTSYDKKLIHHPGIKRLSTVSGDARFGIQSLKDYYNFVTDILFSTTFNIDIIPAIEKILKIHPDSVYLTYDDPRKKAYQKNNVFKYLDGMSIEEGINILDQYPENLRYSFKDMIAPFEMGAQSFEVKKLFTVADEMIKAAPLTKEQTTPKKRTQIYSPGTGIANDPWTQTSYSIQTATIAVPAQQASAIQFVQDYPLVEQDVFEDPPEYEEDDYEEDDE